MQSGRGQGFALLGLFVTALTISVLVEESLRETTLCGVKALSGLPCPFCGGLRATAALGQGELVQAFFWNPAATLLHLGLIVSGVSLVLGREPPWLVSGRQRTVFSFSIAALGLNWIWLIAVSR